MKLLYAVNWKKIGDLNDSRNLIRVQVTCLDERGRLCRIEKLYEDWIGVCTDDIDSLSREINECFPGLRFRFDRFGEERVFRKVLPYFSERLKRKNRLGGGKALPFYKMYVERSCPPEEMGKFFRRYEISYYHERDWVVRLYLDFGFEGENRAAGFLYRWYRYDSKSPMLLDAFRPSEESRLPDFTLAAFDIETIPGDDSQKRDRIPDGTDPDDRVVMISLVTWNRRGIRSERVLYLNPVSFRLSNLNEEVRKRIRLRLSPRCVGGGGDVSLLRLHEYDTESDLLNDFHYFLRDVHVLTGYNIDRFDLPCIFARLLFLRRHDLLSRYSSCAAGENVVVTFDDKIVLDLYPYFKTFSNYDLCGFKLDQVAKAKLGKGSGKIAVDSVGIRVWYRSLVVSRNELGQPLELCRSQDIERCRRLLFQSDPPIVPPEKFGTFILYLEYCLRDSRLVRELFEKETVLDFLTARARFAAVDVVQALHYGNSRFLLEVFRAYGTLLGFFVNVDFFENRTDARKYSSISVDGDKYQGALNYCRLLSGEETFYRDVAVLDFESMYPTALLCSNLCYGTCDVWTVGEYERLDPEVRDRLTVIPYRRHSEADFEDPESEAYREILLLEDGEEKQVFRYPTADLRKDEFVVLIDPEGEAFLPSLVKHFLELRRRHRNEFTRTRDVVHYNVQLCIKILINSLYGTMASKNSPLGYIPVAMAVVTLARYQLLGAFRYVRDVLGLVVCYADTDSLMVHGWPVECDHCDVLDDFFCRSLPHVRVKFEMRMRRLLVVSKKRYVYETPEGDIVTKGFHKTANGIVQFLTDKCVRSVMDLPLGHHHGRTVNPADGWIAWVEALTEALYMCRDPKKYAVTRKTRKLSEYKSSTCPVVRMLKNHPEKEGDYIDYAFSRADVAEEEASRWVMSPEECRYVNFEKLFVDQKKNMCAVLNATFWKMKDPTRACDAVLNTIRWKYFVHAELVNYARVVDGVKCEKKLIMLMEKGVRYTFRPNDHLFENSKILGCRKNETTGDETARKRIATK